MTIIAWDGKTLAADKQTTAAGMRTQTTKIKRTATGVLLGAAGDSGRCRELLAWFEAGRQRADFPDKDAKAHVLAVVEGAAWFFDGSPEPIVIEEKFWAIGSGRDYAMAAMELGKTAAQAVELACKFDVNCGKGIDTLEP